MGFIALKCPNCSSDIMLDDSREFGFCQYCGTKIIQDRVIIEHKGKIQIDHTKEIENLLIRAQEFISKGNLKEAKNYYNKILDLDANNIDERRGIKNIRDIIVNSVISKAQDLFDKKSYKESEELFKKVVEIDPNNQIALKRLEEFETIICDPNVFIVFKASDMASSFGKLKIKIDNSFDDFISFPSGGRQYKLAVGIHSITFKVSGDYFTKNTKTFNIDNRHTKISFNIKCRWDNKLIIE